MTPPLEAPPARLGAGRAAAIILLGPLVGAITFLIAVMIYDPAPGGFDDFIAVLPFVLVFGWCTGLLPAIGAALVWHIAVPPGLDFAVRAVASLVIGAISGVLGSLPFLILVLGARDIPPQAFVFMAISGAAALAATALPGSR